MSDVIPFDRSAPKPADGAVTVAPNIVRLVCDNPGPFTFSGTCTYLVGTDMLAVIDPGPDDPQHRSAILAAVAGRPVAAILVSHTHRDHSPGAAALAAETGAQVYGEGPHRFVRPPRPEEAVGVDASADREFEPDFRLRDGDTVRASEWALRAVATPGHCANHLAFVLEGTGHVFSGDHVMAWSTSIVAPPDGSIRDYMASLERLQSEAPGTLWPGHGGPVTDPSRLIRGLIHHRRAREASILSALGDRSRSIPDLVAEVYAGLDPRLVGAAQLNTLAHLEDLVARGKVSADGDAALGALFRRA